MDNTPSENPNTPSSTDPGQSQVAADDPAATNSYGNSTFSSNIDDSGITPGTTLSPVIDTMAQSPTPAPTDAANSASKKKRFVFFNKTTKLALIVVVIILVVGAAAYAAYEKFDVDNKPINILKTAFVNSIKQQDITATGTFSASSSSTPLSSGFTLELVPGTKAIDLALNLDIEKTTIPIEVRLIDSNIYFKIGSISSLYSLINNYSSTYGPIVAALGAQLANHWFEVPSTILDDSQSYKCFMNASWSLTSGDVNLLGSNFTKYNFLTINSYSATSLNGISVEKYNLTINNKEASTYLNSLNNLSIAKSFSACDKTSSTSSATKSALSSGTTPITVWVNKGSKEIVQLSAKYTDPTNKGDSGQGTIDFNYSPVNLSAPANAEPITELLASLEKDFGGSSSNLNL